MAGRAKKTLVEMARCLLLQAKLPKTYWYKALAAACYLRNPLSTNKESKSPFEKIIGKKFQLEKLKKFGCTFFVQGLKISRIKLHDEKASKFNFSGYIEQNPGYVVRDIQTKIAFVATNAIFK